MIQKLVNLTFLFISLFSINIFAQNQTSDISEIIILKDSNSYTKKMELINKAKNRVWMSTMVFDCSPTSRTFFDQLIQKQKVEKIDVRIIAESVYVESASNSCFDYLIKNQIKIIQVADHLKKDGEIARMMHQKYLIVDNDEIVMGGLNFTRFNNEANEINQYNRDTDVYLKSNRLVNTLIGEFTFNWNTFSKENKIKPELSQSNLNDQLSCRIVIENPRRNKKEIEQFLATSITDVKSTLKMYSPDVEMGKNPILPLLINRIRSGLKYELIRHGENELANENSMYLDYRTKANLANGNKAAAAMTEAARKVATSNANATTRKQLKALKKSLGDQITVYDYPRYSHSKIFIFDDQVGLIGSLNFNDQSLNTNYEIGFACDDSRFIKQLLDLYQEDIKVSKQVSPF